MLQSVWSRTDSPFVRCVSERRYESNLTKSARSYRSGEFDLESVLLRLVCYVCSLLVVVFVGKFQVLGKRLLARIS